MLISLIGYRGTGKTTVGSLLAERLGWACIDSDVQVEHDAGVSIRQIFESEGENGFRDRESAVILKLTRMHKIVLALGGGAILREENRKAFMVAGPTVWLSAEPEELYRRISDDPSTASSRPNLTADGGFQEICSVLEQRSPIYEHCADAKIQTDSKTPREVVDEIIERLDLASQLASI